MVRGSPSLDGLPDAALMPREGAASICSVATVGLDAATRAELRRALPSGLPAVDVLAGAADGTPLGAGLVARDEGESEPLFPSYIVQLSVLLDLYGAAVDANRAVTFAVMGRGRGEAATAGAAFAAMLGERRGKGYRLNSELLGDGDLLGASSPGTGQESSATQAEVQPMASGPEPRATEAEAGATEAEASARARAKAKASAWVRAWVKKRKQADAAKPRTGGGILDYDRVLSSPDDSAGWQALARSCGALVELLYGVLSVALKARRGAPHILRSVFRRNWTSSKTAQKKFPDRLEAVTDIQTFLKNMGYVILVASLWFQKKTASGGSYNAGNLELPLYLQTEVNREEWAGEPGSASDGLATPCGEEENLTRMMVLARRAARAEGSMTPACEQFLKRYQDATWAAGAYASYASRKLDLVLTVCNRIDEIEAARGTRLSGDALSGFAFAVASSARAIQHALDPRQLQAQPVPAGPSRMLDVEQNLFASMFEKGTQGYTRLQSHSLGRGWSDPDKTLITGLIDFVSGGASGSWGKNARVINRYLEGPRRSTPSDLASSFFDDIDAHGWGGLRVVRDMMSSSKKYYVSNAVVQRREANYLEAYGQHFCPAASIMDNQSTCSTLVGAQGREGLEVGVTDIVIRSSTNRHYFRFRCEPFHYGNEGGTPESYKASRWAGDKQGSKPVTHMLISAYLKIGALTLINRANIPRVTVNNYCQRGDDGAEGEWLPEVGAAQRKTFQWKGPDAPDDVRTDTRNVPTGVAEDTSDREKIAATWPKKAPNTPHPAIMVPLNSGAGSSQWVSPMDAKKCLETVIMALSSGSSKSQGTASAVWGPFIDLLGETGVKGDRARRQVLEASFIKMLGDFSQEVLFTFDNSGYVGPIWGRSQLVDEPGRGRLGLSNDRPAAVRSIVMLLFGQGDVNTNSIGGLMIKTGAYFVATRSPLARSGGALQGSRRTRKKSEGAGGRRTRRRK